MKKMLTSLAISFSVLSFMPNAMANTLLPVESSLPAFEEENHIRQDKHRSRENLGVKRLKKHKWQQGYVMPQHYRGNRYKVDYSDHDLPKPKRQQQWYKINKDYVLIDADNNSILQIKNF